MNVRGDEKNTGHSDNVVTNVTNVTETQVRTRFEKDNSQDKNSSKNLESKDVTGAHRAHRAHNGITTVQTNHIDDVSATKEVLSGIWPTYDINEIMGKDNDSEFHESITASDVSDASDTPIPRLDLKHTRAAVVRTNEDLVSKDDS